eukprot:TRINITY_DN7953_c0_g1_i2.p1 TRINITY_DN7953_c0_g1~~TRINITY_DN7953_c0_g1_i2.p1  ORF type:complete len:203 (+),score=41.68 TRINITY_DN7953_c0_g1_i2:59-610(+)
MATASEENLSLPKGTVAKLIKEHLPPNLKCSNEVRDLVLECCNEFVNLISSEASVVCASDKKNMIGPQHLITALEKLEFRSYIPEVQALLQNHQEEAKETRKRNQKKMKKSTPSDPDAKARQAQLFARARGEPVSSPVSAPVLSMPDPHLPPPPNFAPPPQASYSYLPSMGLPIPPPPPPPAY